MKKYQKGMIHPVSFYEIDEMEPIEFRPVTYPGVKPDHYLVSNYGDVYSLVRSKYVTPFQTEDGHVRVSLCATKHKDPVRNSKGVKFSVHQLVAHEFLEPDPREDANIINHKDGIPYKNYYRNLEYCTDMENRMHAKEMGLFSRGEENPQSKYSETLVREICSMFEQGKSIYEIQKELSGTRSYNRSLYDLIRKIYKKESWVHISKEYNF